MCQQCGSFKFASAEKTGYSVYEVHVASTNSQPLSFI